MPTQPRFALYMQDKHPLGYELEIAEYAEARGFSEIWQADTRLARDCVVMMSAFLTRTKRCASAPACCRSGRATRL
jgi:5,10-methylenetetrahydromethanopterin reductase